MRYRVDFIDHGGRVYSSEVLDAPSDVEAIRTARRIFANGIGNGFEIRRDAALVHRELPGDGAQPAAAGARDYRVCFYDALGTQMGRLDIAAGNDAEALDVAAVLYDACSDVCSYYDMWKGEKAVRKAEYFLLAPTVAELSRHTQQIVLDREMAIRDSQWHIADSRRLIEKMGAWNDELQA